MEKTDCDYCQNSGEHLAPDLTQPILIPCTKKGCIHRVVDISNMDLDEEEQ